MGWELFVDGGVSGRTNVIDLSGVNFVALGLFDGSETFGELGQTLLNVLALEVARQLDTVMHLVESMCRLPFHPRCHP